MPALIPALFVSASTSRGIFVLGGAVREPRRGFETLPELPVSLTQESPLVPLPIMPRFITVRLGHTHSFINCTVACDRAAPLRLAEQWALAGSARCSTAVTNRDPHRA